MLHLKEIILVRLKALLNQRRLVLLNISVKWIINNDLVVNLIVDFDVRRGVDLRHWRANTANLLLSFKFIHVLMILITHLLFLGYGRRLGLWNTPLPVIRPGLVDCANIVLQALLVPTLLSPIVILHVSVAWRPFIFNHGQWRLLSILIWTIVFGDRCGRTSVLDILVQFSRHKWVSNRHSDVI
jgi:hypothetical protein